MSISEIPTVIHDLPPGGDTLRQTILDRLKAASLENIQQATQIFKEFDETYNPIQIWNVLQVKIQQARRDSHWSSGELSGEIIIGYYPNEDMYNALLFHEASHSIINTLKKSKPNSCLSKDREEDFCWRFAHGVCQALTIPYEKQVEVLYRKMNDVLQKISRDSENESLHAELHSIAKEQHQLMGYSEFDGTPML